MDSAFEKARAAYGTGAYDDATLEFLFPQLKESEDERIRKWIAKYIHRGVFNEEEHPMALKAIEYLEKQKEQEHICDSAQYEEGFKTGLEIGLRKQKEQKPIEWTELTWKDIVELEGIINNVHYEFRNGIGQESFGKEVLEKFREYKGDEYLEEKEQKPAEWSEEDEENMELVIDCIYNFYPDPVIKYKLKDWLKSLRPSWKPSKEQMEAFRSYIKDFQEKAEAAVGGWNNFDVMIRLFEQLKKLGAKEEPEYYQHFDPDC